MHVSKPRVISQGLEDQYTIDFAGIKTRVEIHRVMTVESYHYIAYLIDEVPDWFIGMPTEHILDWLGSGTNPT